MTLLTLQLAISRLKGVKKTEDGYLAFCPCHDDKHQSLSIKESPEGKLLLYCHAGCSFEKIVKALDLPKPNEKITPIITDTYDYTDALSNESYQVVRYMPKAFRQRRSGEGGWIWDKKGITPNLYKRELLEKAVTEGKVVFVVEGEKDVLNLMEVGQVATSISGGASTKWHPSLIPLFEGAKVVIIPDNDDAGRKYSLYVASLLYGWCASLKVINLQCKDVSDYLETQSIGLISALDKLLQIIDNTKEYIPQGAVTREEFNSFRGVNLYLWSELKKRKPKRQPKFD